MTADCFRDIFSDQVVVEIGLDSTLMRKNRGYFVSLS